MKGAHYLTQVDVLLKEPDFTLDTGLLCVEPATLEWQPVDKMDPLVCEHEMTLCAKCAGTWAQDYYIRTKCNRGHIQYSADYPVEPYFVHEEDIMPDNNSTRDEIKAQCHQSDYQRAQVIHDVLDISLQSLCDMIDSDKWVADLEYFGIDQTVLHMHESLHLVLDADLGDDGEQVQRVASVDYMQALAQASTYSLKIIVEIAKEMGK